MSRHRSGGRWPNASFATGTIVTAESNAAAAPYVGRFAPSPTGPLHFGSLLAAVASFLQARSNDGRWLLRIEDIDPPREKAGADRLIVHALERYGFEWDGDIRYQSNSAALHRDAISRLRDSGYAYECGCSRRDLADVPRGPLGPIYPGTCRNGSSATEFAIRVRTDNQPVCFDDLLQGRQCQRLESESGDFVIHRRDGLVAYHLAVVADDADQSVSEIVRGIDLMDSTPRQIHLQRLLGLPTPAYMHVPVAVNAAGQKLSKLTGAPAVPADDPRPTLVVALRALRLPADDELRACRLDDIWQWAMARWQPAALAGVSAIPLGPDSPLSRT
ncbi:MAG: tRNA glutamyl-Q(34) synthetase GluQRS [Woeseiaceae bacterium]|nr:tRNA glutamyl-Q(34) synthetase GluQRS [Woeseiaceae bacterium]